MGNCVAREASCSFDHWYRSATTCIVQNTQRSSMRNMTPANLWHVLDVDDLEEGERICARFMKLCTNQTWRRSPVVSVWRSLTARSRFEVPTAKCADAFTHPSISVIRSY